MFLQRFTSIDSLKAAPAGGHYLVDNTSDLNKPVSTATATQLGLKQNTSTFGKSTGNALKLQDAVITNDVLVMGGTNVVGLTYTQLKTALQITDTTYNSGRNITIHTSTNDLDLNTTLTSVNSIKSYTIIRSVSWSYNRPLFTIGSTRGLLALLPSHQDSRSSSTL